MSKRTRHEVEAELSEARADLLRHWPSERPTFKLDDAPNADAKAALQRVMRLQNELDATD
ncbi:MAG: hypothetical protein M0R73_09860 [Dehalococcoidia bacterium]|nr:hypothetical protein [Dehalococcoidia bacterium]